MSSIHAKRWRLNCEEAPVKFSTVFIYISTVIFIATVIFEHGTDACNSAKTAEDTKSYWMNAEDIVDYLEPGDLVEIHMGWYKHWAMYYKDGEMIDVRQDDKEFATIRTVPLTSLATENMVRKFNKESSGARRGLGRRSNKEALAAALQFLHKRVPYNFLGTNCEYYVTLWAFGTGWSDQLPWN